MRVAIYARVSKHDQTTANQLPDCRRYVEARGWTLTGEYIDEGVSGAKERRPALDELTTAAKRRQIDAVVCWRLDRLGRNLRHLVFLLDDWQHHGITFVTLGEGIDTSTPAGRLVAGVLASIAEFERARCAERVRATLCRLKAEGHQLGRPKSAAAGQLAQVAGLSHTIAAAQLGVSVATVKRWRRATR
jgi:DNA invertase Pin-like site-specific DNA recombinase